jgi:hypothetical protein
MLQEDCAASAFARESHGRYYSNRSIGGVRSINIRHYRTSLQRKRISCNDGWAEAQEGAHGLSIRNSPSSGFEPLE